MKLQGRKVQREKYLQYIWLLWVKSSCQHPCFSHLTPPFPFAEQLEKGEEERQWKGQHNSLKNNLVFKWAGDAVNIIWHCNPTTQQDCPRLAQQSFVLPSVPSVVTSSSWKHPRFCRNHSLIGLMKALHPEILHAARVGLGLKHWFCLKLAGNVLKIKILRKKIMKTRDLETSAWRRSDVAWCGPQYRFLQVNWLHKSQDPQAASWGGIFF